MVNPNNPDWSTAAVRLVRSSETVRRALWLLNENLFVVLRIGLALGLAAHDVKRAELVQGSIRGDFLLLKDGSLSWDVDAWKAHLVNHNSVDSATVDQLAARFEHRMEIAARSDDSSVRWGCDGHIGMRLIW